MLLSAALCLVCLVSVAVTPRTASAQVAGTGPAGVTGGSGTMFAGSMVSYRNVVSAVSLDKNIEPTWNPYYAMTLMLAPRVFPVFSIYKGKKAHCLHWPMPTLPLTEQLLNCSLAM